MAAVVDWHLSDGHSTRSRPRHFPARRRWSGPTRKPASPVAAQFVGRVGQGDRGGRAGAGGPRPGCPASPVAPGRRDGPVAAAGRGSAGRDHSAPAPRRRACRGRGLALLARGARDRALRARPGHRRRPPRPGGPAALARPGPRCLLLLARPGCRGVDLGPRGGRRVGPDAAEAEGGAAAGTASARRSVHQVQLPRGHTKGLPPGRRPRLGEEPRNREKIT